MCSVGSAAGGLGSAANNTAASTGSNGSGGALNLLSKFGKGFANGGGLNALNQQRQQSMPNQLQVMNDLQPLPTTSILQTLLAKYNGGSGV